MALTKLGGISEIATCVVIHGLLGYVGTNLGNIYSVVISTGVFTKLDCVNEKIVSMVINHPTLYITTNKGNFYSYSITVSDDKYAPLIIGEQANTAGSGVPISASQVGALRIFSDDAGVNIGDSVRGIQSRFLLTVDQSAGTIRALQGQLKLLTGVDVTTGIYTAVQGYVELVGTHIVKTGATFSCFDASLEIGTGVTIDSGGELFGVHVETTGAGTITNNGTCAGIGITAASGAAAWPLGISMLVGSVLRGIQIGAWVGSGAAGAAIPMATAIYPADTSQANIVGVYGESTTDLTSGIHATIGRFRHLVVGSSLQVNHETYGLVGQLVGKSASLLHMHAGLMGTLEANTTALVCNGAYAFSVAAVIARIGGGGLITATKPVAGFSAILNGADVASGSIVAFAACATSTGNWTHLLASGSCDNILYAPTGTAYECGVKIATQLTGNAYPKMDGVIRMMIDTTAYYIPFYAAGNIDNE